jgi:hypothetical protein
LPGSSSDRPSEWPQGQIGKGDDSPLQPIPQLHPKDAAGSALVQGVNAELGVFELAEPRKTNTGDGFTGVGR